MNSHRTLNQRQAESFRDTASNLNSKNFAFCSIDGTFISMERKIPIGSAKLNAVETKLRAICLENNMREATSADVKFLEGQTNGQGLTSVSLNSDDPMNLVVKISFERQLGPESDDTDPELFAGLAEIQNYFFDDIEEQLAAIKKAA